MIYLLPFIAAFTGWLTNFVAVKMLFHPRKPIRVLGIKIQGVFPKRQLQLAEKLGGVVANELFSAADVVALIKNPKTTESAMAHIEQHVNIFVDEKLPAKMPMLAMFLNADLKAKIKGTLMEEFQKMIPGVMDQFANDIQQKLDVKAIVYEKVANFSSDKFEEILFAIMRKEFRLIEFLGAVLGFVIGIIQLLLVKLN